MLLVAAIETREYHVKCHTCRFGKWCGQSKQQAEQVANRHESTHAFHVLSIDYLRYPDTYEAFRANYGRSRQVQWFINGPKLVMRSGERIAEDVPPF